MFIDTVCDRCKTKCKDQYNKSILRVVSFSKDIEHRELVPLGLCKGCSDLLISIIEKRVESFLKCERVKMKNYVVIKEIGTDKIVKELGPMSESKADNVVNGVEINMDHENFYVEIEDRE